MTTPTTPPTPASAGPTVAEAADAAAVVALWHACGLTRPWNDPATDFARALQGVQSTVLVLRDDGRIVATAMVGDDGHRGWVYYLAVAQDRRGAGVGRAMMTAAEDWLRARGAPKIQFMVREDNAATIAFYQRLGYQRQAVVTLGRFLDSTERT